jgi:hypothetical protein
VCEGDEVTVLQRLYDVQYGDSEDALSDLVRDTSQVFTLELVLRHGVRLCELSRQ